MQKIWLIIKREYWTRISSKAFWIGTILFPLGIVGLIFFQVKLMGYKDDKVKKIVVQDLNKVLKNNIKDEKSLKFTFSDDPLEVLKTRVSAKEFDGLVQVPLLTNLQEKEQKVDYFSDEQLATAFSLDLSQKFAEAIRSYKMETLGIDRSKLESLKTSVTIQPQYILRKEKTSSLASVVATAIGSIMGFILYFAVIMNGSMVMRSVMEEKTSRISEVMISSVKPFELMMGKIIGVGAVGMTQLLTTSLLFVGGSSLLTLFMGGKTPPPSAMPRMGGMGNMNNMPDMNTPEAQGQMSLLMEELGRQNWAAIIPLFLMYFLLGYFMYASLFAAVGSAVGDDQGEAQTLMLPLMLPIILAVYITISVVQSPDSKLAVWSSIFPLFSPIVMPARLAYNPPFWQVALSITLLIATVIGAIWMAGRIYRVGILMYGKKASFKELGKWMFYKD